MLANFFGQRAIPQIQHLRGGIQLTELRQLVTAHRYLPPAIEDEFIERQGTKSWMVFGEVSVEI
jgi:hypothetical protein